MPTASRGKYQGVLQIVRFNWTFYVTALLLLAGGSFLLTTAPMPLWLCLACLIAMMGAAFWLTSSLLVAHYVYDHSSIYDPAWIQHTCPAPPARWANFHAGFDEFAPILALAFPDSNGTRVDFFDPDRMTEPSIKRARQGVVDGAESVPASASALPFADGELEAAFVFFSAHELRQHEARVRFFSELKRVLKPTGRIVLLEHLRDWPNLIGFGPGFFHFHSRRTWMRAIESSGLAIIEEFSVTPFVRVFVLAKIE